MSGNLNSIVNQPGDERIKWMRDWVVGYFELRAHRTSTIVNGSVVFNLMCRILTRNEDVQFLINSRFYDDFQKAINQMVEDCVIASRKENELTQCAGNSYWFIDPDERERYRQIRKANKISQKSGTNIIGMLSRHGIKFEYDISGRHSLRPVSLDDLEELAKLLETRLR